MTFPVLSPSKRSSLISSPSDTGQAPMLCDVSCTSWPLPMDRTSRSVYASTSELLGGDKPTAQLTYSWTSILYTCRSLPAPTTRSARPHRCSSSLMTKAFKVPGKRLLAVHAWNNRRHFKLVEDTPVLRESNSVVHESSPLRPSKDRRTKSLRALLGRVRPRDSITPAIVKDSLVLSLEGLMQSSDAFPPLKSALGGLLFLLSQVRSLLWTRSHT